MGDIAGSIARRGAQYLQDAGMLHSLVCNKCRVGSSRLRARYYVAGRIAISLLCPQCMGDRQMDIGKTESTMRWGERAGWIIVGMWIELAVLGLYALLFG